MFNSSDQRAWKLTNTWMHELINERALCHNIFIYHVGVCASNNLDPLLPCFDSAVNLSPSPAGRVVLMSMIIIVMCMHAHSSIWSAGPACPPWPILLLVSTTSSLICFTTAATSGVGWKGQAAHCSVGNEIKTLMCICTSALSYVSSFSIIAWWLMPSLMGL